MKTGDTGVGRSATAIRFGHVNQAPRCVDNVLAITSIHCSEPLAVGAYRHHAGAHTGAQQGRDLAGLFVLVATDFAAFIGGVGFGVYGMPTVWPPPWVGRGLVGRGLCTVSGATLVDRSDRM